MSSVFLSTRRDQRRNVFDDIAAISKRCKIGIVGDEHGSEIPASDLSLFDRFDCLFGVFWCHPKEKETDSDLRLIDRKTLPSRSWHQ